MIGEKLSGFYLSLEDKWFKMLDWLDSKGLPVYAYSDFLRFQFQTSTMTLFQAH